MSSRQTQRIEETSSNSNSYYMHDPSLPLAAKIEEVHISNLENIINMLCELMKKLVGFIEQEEIQISQKLFNPKTIIAIKDATNELKYHQKINPISTQQPAKNVTEDLELIIQLLTKMKVHPNQGILPKVKKIQDFHGHGLASQLSTITQKQSEQNLLHNYLKKGHNKKRSKSNINKNFYMNTSSIDDLQFEVIREQTRKSLENPYHKNNQHRKGLYNDLQKMKGQDSMLPAVKNYLDKHRKAAEVKSKLAPYQIQKLL